MAQFDPAAGAGSQGADLFDIAGLRAEACLFWRDNQAGCIFSSISGAGLDTAAIEGKYDLRQID